MLRILIILGGLIIANTSFAQVDSTAVLTDTTRAIGKPLPVKPPTKAASIPKTAERIRLEKMPPRAAFRSAVIPGWGQLTNKRWWKIPLVYGGFVGIALIYDFNQTNYKIFLTEAQNRDFNRSNPKALRPLNPAFVPYDNTGIITIKDGYRRNRDLTILGGAAFYVVTIIDAYVDAKFFRFDISDDLALQVKPSVQQPYYSSFATPLPSVTVKLSFSK